MFLTGLYFSFSVLLIKTTLPATCFVDHLKYNPLCILYYLIFLEILNTSSPDTFFLFLLTLKEVFSLHLLYLVSRRCKFPATSSLNYEGRVLHCFPMDSVYPDLNQVMESHCL